MNAPRAASLCTALILLSLSAALAQAASYSWKGTVGSDWHTPENWDQNGVPGPNDDVLVTNTGNPFPVVTQNCSVRSLTIQGPAIVTVNGVTLIVQDTNLEVLNGATLGGTGRVNFAGSVLANSGVISVSNFGFIGAGVQNVSGSGQWTCTGFEVRPTSTTSLSSDVIIGPPTSGFWSSFALNGTLALSGHNLTLNQVSMLVGNPFLVPATSGQVNGPGNVVCQGTANELNLGPGSFNAPLLVAAGTLYVPTAMIPLSGATTVAFGAVLQPGNSTQLQVNGDLTVGGTLSGYNSTSKLLCGGTNMVNVGVITVAFAFNRPGSQSVSGNGQWTGANVEVAAGSTTTLAGDITLGPPMSGGWLSFAVNGTLSTGGNTLVLNMVSMLVGNPFTSATGNVLGSGTVRCQGVANELNFGVGSFTAPLLVAAGTAYVPTAMIPLSGPTTVAGGASLRVGLGTTLQANGDVTVNGTLYGYDQSSRFRSAGATTVNSGVVSVANFGFNRAGVQIVSGGGLWSGANIEVAPGSTTTLGGTVTIGPPASGIWVSFADNGSVALNGNTLTLNSVSMLVGNPFSLVPGQVNGPGTVRCQNVANELNFGAGSFNAPLLVAAGTSYVPTAVIPLGGPITVAPGAEMRVGNGTTLQANGDLTVAGTLSGISPTSSRVHFGGPVLVNSGAITIPRLFFNRAGAQTVSGSGSWSTEVAIQAPSTTSLGSDVTLGPWPQTTLIVYGTLDVAGHALTVLGSFIGIPPGGVLKGNGTLAYGATTLSNQGRIEPGASPGLLVLNGILDQDPGATLVFEITGHKPIVEYDRLAVTGLAILKDTLRIEFPSSYTPNPGDSFPIISMGSRSGTFDAVLVNRTNLECKVQYSDTAVVLNVLGLVGVEGDPDGDPTTHVNRPTRTMLRGIAPNPSVQSTNVQFDLASDQPVRLVVFDASGRRVRVLADDWLGAGTHRRPWDGRDDHGNRVAPGVYLLRFEAGPVRQVQRLVRISG